jgi:hypothetical protein
MCWKQPDIPARLSTLWSNGLSPLKKQLKTGSQNSPRQLSAKWLRGFANCCAENANRPASRAIACVKCLNRTHACRYSVFSKIFLKNFHFDFLYNQYIILPQRFVKAINFDKYSIFPTNFRYTKELASPFTLTS